MRMRVQRKDLCGRVTLSYIYIYILYTIILYSLEAQKDNYRDEQSQQGERVALHVQIIDEITKLQRVQVIDSSLPLHTLPLYCSSTHLQIIIVHTVGIVRPGLIGLRMTKPGAVVQAPSRSRGEDACRMH